MKDQVDAWLSIGARGDIDLVDQSVEQGPRVGHRFGVTSSDRGHVFDLAAIVFDDGGMCHHRVDFGKFGLFGQQRLPPGSQFVGARLQLVGRNSRNDGVGDAVFRLFNVSQLAIDVSAARDQAAAFFSPCHAKFVEIGGDNIGME